MYQWTTILGGILLLGATMAQAQEEKKTEEPAPKAKELTTAEKACYGIGLNIGKTLQRQGLEEIDPKHLAQGIIDAYGDKEPKFDEEELQAAIQAFQQEIVAKRAAKSKAQGEMNQKDGEKFLAENKTKEGVKTLASGLQYKVLKEGTGAIPKETDEVTTHYRGTLLNGTEFDSSYKRGEPASFPVNGVIKGWTEALKLMKVGSKWQLFIPGELAYGSSPPQGSGIGPNSVLLFDIELLGISE